MIKRIVFLILLTISSTFLFSQEVEKSLVSTAGEVNHENGITLSWSIGEVVISSETVGEGYQFPSELQDVILSIKEDFDLTVDVFPNPTADYITIRTNLNNPDLDIRFFDSGGRIITPRLRNNGELLTYNLGTLAAGIYIINIVDQRNKLSKSYRIIKK